MVGMDRRRLGCHQGEQSIIHRRRGAGRKMRVEIMLAWSEGGWLAVSIVETMGMPVAGCGS